MTESLFTSQTPSTQTTEANPGPTLGLIIQAAVDGTISALRWYPPDSLPSNASTLPFILYDYATQAELARAVPGSLTAGIWNRVAITPVSITAGQKIMPCVRTADRYALIANYFLSGAGSAGLVNGDLSSPATGSDPIGNGRFVSETDGFPDDSFGGHCYLTDIEFTPAGGGPTVSVWTGSAEVDAAVTVWNGSSEVAAAVAEVV